MISSLRSNILLRIIRKIIANQYHQIRRNQIDIVYNHTNSSQFGNQSTRNQNTLKSSIPLMNLIRRNCIGLHQYMRIFQHNHQNLRSDQLLEGDHLVNILRMRRNYIRRLTKSYNVSYCRNKCQNNIQSLNNHYKNS